ncbi:hypothetical protein SAMN04487948_103209 [Halogranum amylolyticum]|uniref:Uncharacterized protein n=1 Tax=Halogranum amylolyticum TaxID=660520 RepID=A0A1H8QNF7_9EURY|nr:hypothetical protein SAMN04487948_103209 [Halogranum amylolyticum]
MTELLACLLARHPDEFVDQSASGVVAVVAADVAGDPLPCDERFERSVGVGDDRDAPTVDCVEGRPVERVEVVDEEAVGVEGDECSRHLCRGPFDHRDGVAVGEKIRDRRSVGDDEHVKGV